MKKSRIQEDGPVSCLPPASHLPWQERYEIGRNQRSVTQRSAHAEWDPPADRDMIGLLQASNLGRVESLVPIRHGRMLASPFTFYRGAPAVMAYDLAHTPSSSINVQLN